MIAIFPPRSIVFVQSLQHPSLAMSLFSLPMTMCWIYVVIHYISGKIWSRPGMWTGLGNGIDQHSRAWTTWVFGGLVLYCSSDIAGKRSLIKPSTSTSHLLALVFLIKNIILRDCSHISSPVIVLSRLHCLSDEFLTTILQALCPIGIVRTLKFAYNVTSWLGAVSLLPLFLTRLATRQGWGWRRTFGALQRSNAAQVYRWVKTDNRG